MIKIIIVVLLLFIFLSLFKAMFVMLKSGQQGSMAKQLLNRVYASIAVILIICLAAQFDLIKLHSSPISTTHKQIQTNTATPHQQSANTKHQPETQSDFSH
ncbi:DUF2909 domain-containing protein [Pseudoalteromonas sp. McH1-7]|uniref:DUF2909 family protein n=1 Tax=Pseudoalteromonas TaxID=53246 RepID=UPI000F64CC83|nr:MULTISPECIES: DUF2909 family protein [Pseudoalteromonas]MDW7551444.1 DUF2909 family protein [Pseudoalteromonas peptidolytica]NLR17165.1 DUF2909 domain-containing protein [Pseudoalteromonas peptidolytica]NUZ13004.1 DUF2909 domain-containing protein [Pseudoalteromonas sp. McH1-7]RRS07284.1 DUF2909 domain-containing protein [Pseudoalteromonas sp. J010]RXF01423.1 DUF2909 domain-containing protein [Pseudoalteromonas sp. PS5]